jgi:CBS domain-containing protein
VVNASNPGPEEFQDPLENFEPKEFDDPLEQALVEEEIGTIRHEPFTTISPDTTIQKAVELLAERHIACLLVAEQDKLVGVFSERDVMARLALEFEDWKHRPVRDAMTSDPVYVNEIDSAVSALTVMAVCGCRHVPVVDLDEKLTGIISPQRITDFLRKHFIGE